MTTVLTNRLGDCLLLLGALLLLSSGEEKQPLPSTWEVVVLLAVLLGALTKRAQFPFSTWLPLAIAAPTPISALVHSSTLVTGGYVILVLFSPTFFSSLGLVLCVWAAIVAGIKSLMEGDYKKLIALSTLTQISLIWVIWCWGATLLSFLYLTSHAFFKSSLFMAAGVVIHYNLREQRRKIYRVFVESRATRAWRALSVSSLIGITFSSVFFLKDLFLENVLGGPTRIGMRAVLFFTILFTINYSWKLFHMVVGRAGCSRGSHPAAIGLLGCLVPLVLSWSLPILLAWNLLPLEQPALPTTKLLLPLLWRVAFFFYLWGRSGKRLGLRVKSWSHSRNYYR